MAWMKFEKKEKKKKKTGQKAQQPGVITIRLPRDLNELLHWTTQWLHRATPLLKGMKYIFACIFVLALLGMKDTIATMEFDPSLTGLMVWAMLMWLAIKTGFD